MSISKDEKERQHYNKKLMKETALHEAVKSPQFGWFEIITTGIGAFTGILINHLAGVEERAPNGIVSFLIEVLVVACCMFIAEKAAYSLRRAYRKKKAAPEQKH